MQLHHSLVFMVLCMAAAGVNAGSCLPIPTTVPNSCSNDFDLAFPIGDETNLISSIETGFLSTSIKYRFRTGVPDALVVLSWKDKNGAVLFGGNNTGFWGFTGAVDTFEWGETRRGLLHSSKTRIEKGTADFSNSIGINSPCSTFVCNAGYHEFIPSPFSSNGGAENGRASKPVDMTDPQTSIAEIEGTITLFELDPGAPDDLDLATATLALDYTSSVEWSGSEYLYRYAITNHLDVPFDVIWELAALAGTLDPGASIAREFSSLQGPGIVQSVADTRFQSFEFSGGLGLLKPVPIPGSIALFASAIACVAMTGLRKARPNTRAALDERPS